MTSKTIKHFEDLRNAVAADGKIDLVELNVLKNFIEPYCKSGNKDFCLLDNVLNSVTDDNHINDNESKCIIAALDNILLFLKKEARFENIITGIIATILIVLVGIGIFVH